jgi:hypothetical protein
MEEEKGFGEGARGLMIFVAVMLIVFGAAIYLGVKGEFFDVLASIVWHARHLV